MRTTVSSRVFGTIEQLMPTYGYVRGEDGRQYFFLPSYVLSPYDFVDLKVGQRCCFLVTAHPRGLRAGGVTITGTDDVTDAQANSLTADR